MKLREEGRSGTREVKWPESLVSLEHWGVEIEVNEFEALLQDLVEGFGF